MFAADYTHAAGKKFMAGLAPEALLFPPIMLYFPVMAIEKYY
jgi:hypothetical protein